MKLEFRKVGPNSAESARGFTVTWRPSGDVDYGDADGTLHVDSELLVEPLRILDYPRSGDFKTMSDDRAEQILTRIVTALEFLGHQVERW